MVISFSINIFFKVAIKNKVRLVLKEIINEVPCLPR